MRKNLLTAAIAAILAGTSLSAAAADEATTVGGKAYIDFTDIDQKNNGTKAPSSGIGMDVKRFYLAVNHNFDDMWSANVTTDFNYAPVACNTVVTDASTSPATAGAACSPTKETQVFIKKAYLQAKFDDAAVVRAGSYDMPWIPFVEDVYGYRYVENTLIDRLKFGTSADWGLNFGGNVMDNMFNYSISAVNGNGYKNPTRSKTVDFEGRVGVMPVTGLVLAAGFYNGKLGQDVEGVTTKNTATRWDALAAYSYQIVKVGVEYFSADNDTPAAITGTKVKADGYSFWGSVSPMDSVAVFARYDATTPSKDVPNVSDVKDTYYNIGVSYQARKNVDLALVYKNEKVEKGTVSTASSGSITGGTTDDGKYSEIGIWTQVKF